jgi:O-succinylbenzoic acid--CoA ligase
MMIVRAMEADCEVAFCKPSNSFWTNNEVIAYINQGPVDLLPIVPSQCNALLEVAAQQTAKVTAAKGADAMGVAGRLGIALGNIRNVIIGGAAVAPEMERRLLEAMPAGMDIFATYGMTETCSHVALRPLGCDHFTAMPGISFGQDRRDCLTIYAPAYSFGELQTNDIVSRCDKQQAAIDDTNATVANQQESTVSQQESADNNQPASRFLRFRWLGRFDNVINTGGIKVFPEELERLLAGRLPMRFYIKGEPDEKWGEAVVLVTEPTALSDSEIREACAAVLQAYQVPKRIRRIEEIPLTSNGKIRRI